MATHSLRKIFSRHRLAEYLSKHLENDKGGFVHKSEDVNDNSTDVQSHELKRNSIVPEIKISVADSSSQPAFEDELIQRACVFDNDCSRPSSSSTIYGTEVSSTVCVPSKHFYNDDEETPLIKKDAGALCVIQRATSECYSTSDESSSSTHQSKACKILQNIKVVFLCGVMLGSIGLFIAIKNPQPLFMQLSVMENDQTYVDLPNKTTFPIVKVSMRGKFVPKYYDNLTSVDVFVTLQKFDSRNMLVENMSEWRHPYAPASMWKTTPDTIVENHFDLENHHDDWQHFTYKLQLTTNSRNVIPMSVNVIEVPRSIEYGVIFATCILIALYIIIVFDLIHRTLAAMWAGVVAIAVLALLNEKPTLAKVMAWMDIETLALLFGMMVLVAILCETGFFDYVAVLAFRLAKGKRWTVITLMCLFTGVISAFLDNVTTILLFTPVSIRLCEVMELDPKNVLIALVMFSNIGGTATAVGDPPNVIIVSNTEVQQAGIGFANFTMHMAPGAILAMGAAYLLLRVMYRKVVALKYEEPQEVVELRHEIGVWKRAAGSMSLYSRDEKTVRGMLLQKVASLETLLKQKQGEKNPGMEAYEANLLELTKKFKIRNFPLLIKTAVVMVVVILLFFLHSVPSVNISLGWVAIMGSIFLLVLADIAELEHIFARVEWTTLVFFAALFAVMEALNELGLIKFIGTLTENFIMNLPKDMQLGVSIVLILWISAIASSFIDNIPFTTVMIKVVLQIAENPMLQLPLQPLVWALAFGACFGGNGTLIGASANVVCAGVAEQHGYRFTFMEFFKIGFPVMLLTTTVATGYLLLCHVAFSWNYS
ncbi:hypothetical protein CHUAL_004484 [Chamberlinius hualienensis]